MANRTVRISPEEQERMVYLYQSGLSRLQVAAHLDISLPTVNKFLKLRGVEFRPQYEHFFTPEEEAVIVDNYRMGGFIADLAVEAGCTIKTIHKVLRKYGVRLRDDRGNRREYTPDEIETIRTMAAEGKSQNQIARELGSAQGTISDLMTREGIPPAYRGAARGQRHGNWNGGRWMRPDGYIEVTVSRDDPMFVMTKRSGTLLEHRLVMARKLGRPLASHESVHHIDGDTTHNDEDNLQLRQGKHGRGAAFVCADCGSHNIVSTRIKEA